MAGKKTSGNKSQRTRNWLVVIYPDSAPENWRDYIDEMHIGWVESPLHQYDTDPYGEVKKPHWHVLLMFGGVKTYEQVKELLGPLNCPIPQICLSAKGAVRYMAHLDNPEKHQYALKDVIGHGGADINELLQPSSSERYFFIKEMCEYIRQANIMEFQDLMDVAMSEKIDTWFPLLCDNSAYVIGQYIKSQRNRQFMK